MQRTIRSFIIGLTCFSLIHCASLKEARGNEETRLLASKATPAETPDPLEKGLTREKPVVDVSNKSAIIVLKKFIDKSGSTLSLGTHYASLLALNSQPSLIVIEPRDYLEAKPLFSRPPLLIDNADFIVSGIISLENSNYQVEIFVRDTREGETHKLDSLTIPAGQLNGLAARVVTHIVDGLKDHKPGFIADLSMQGNLVENLQFSSEVAASFFNALHKARSDRRAAARMLNKRSILNSGSTLARALALYIDHKDRPRYSSIKRKLISKNTFEARLLAHTGYLLSLKASTRDATAIIDKSVDLVKDLNTANTALYHLQKASLYYRDNKKKSLLDQSLLASVALKKAGLHGTIGYSQLLQARAAALSLENSDEQAAQASYENAKKLLDKYPVYSIHRAIFDFNSSRYYLEKKDYLAAEKSAQAVTGFMKNSRNANSELHFKSQLNLGMSQFFTNKTEEAEESFHQVALACDSLLIKRNLTCARASHYYASALQKNGKKSDARKWFRTAYREYLQARNRALANQAKRGRDSFKPAALHDPFDSRLYNYLGLSYEEDDLLDSYSAPRYRTNPAAFARTYGNRLDDTNVLLKDMLNNPAKSKALAALVQQALGKNKATKGAGILFVDIGPAVANVIEPAVTSVNVAHDFSRMQVVALDLPEEMKRYHKKVLKSAKKRLRTYRNLHLFAGDGLESLSQQLRGKKGYVFKDRPRPDLDQTNLVVIRTANAIDIYVKYRYVRPALKRMADDFKNKPVLLFFNRSILFKAAGQSFFKIIGHLSIRGFHHNKRSLDRRGQKPYTLLPGQLLSR